MQSSLSLSVHGPWENELRRVLEGCPKCRHQKKKEDNFLNRFRPSVQFLKDLKGSPDEEDFMSGKFSATEKVRFVCPTHGLYYQRITDHKQGVGCPMCAHSQGWRSAQEKEIEKYFLDKGIRVEHSVRGLYKSPISGYYLEADLWFPDYKLIVEVNGVYWHTIEHFYEDERRYHAPGGKQNYHLMKTEAALKEGLELIHIYSDEIEENYEECLRLIESRLIAHGYPDARKVLYARKLKFKEIGKAEASEFLNKYHRQKYGRGRCFGLIYDNLLIAIVQIKPAPSNTVDKGSHIIDRYAVRHGYRVIGGFTKLYSDAAKLLNVNRYVTYADRQVSQGDLYKNTGWSIVSVSEPDYMYANRSRRIHKFNFRLKRFKEDPNLLYEEGLTEFGLAKLNGLMRVYDCGKIKFEKVITRS